MAAVSTKCCCKSRTCAPSPVLTSVYGQGHKPFTGLQVSSPMFLQPFLCAEYVSRTLHLLLPDMSPNLQFTWSSKYLEIRQCFNIDVSMLRTLYYFCGLKRLSNLFGHFEQSLNPVLDLCLCFLTRSMRAVCNQTQRLWFVSCHQQSK